LVDLFELSDYLYISCVLDGNKYIASKLPWVWEMKCNYYYCIITKVVINRRFYFCFCLYNCHSQVLCHALYCYYYFSDQTIVLFFSFWKVWLERVLLLLLLFSVSHRKVWNPLCSESV